MASGNEDVQNRWFRGVLEACVSGRLRRGHASRYEIAGRVADPGFARPKGGPLYPILSRLEADQLVVPAWIEGVGGPSRKYYGLTPQGITAADELANQWHHFSANISKLLGDTTRSQS